MIIIDDGLKRREAEGKPIRVGMIGAGFMARGVANQIINSVPGMRLVAISNRNVKGAERAYLEAGVKKVTWVQNLSQLEDTIRDSGHAVSEDPFLLCQSGQIDVLFEVTGAVEFGAQVAMEAIRCRKPLVTMNAELDATVGPILKVYAQRAGVLLSGSDGDQPGVQLNLYRFVKGIGLTPLVCGNIKGLHDPYRNPTTQEGFAKRWGQNPTMVTSFADGTKISIEQAIVANATDMCVIKRGMLGYKHEGHVDDLTKMYDVDELRKLGGIVDYVVGAKPSPGVYVLATHDDPKQRHYLHLYKLGEGPLYSFYTPYHLCHFEVPNSLARAVLVQDPVITPLKGPKVDVITTAKVNLQAGQVLDGLGGYLTYGQCENSDTVRREKLLPIGLAEGCRVKREVSRDQVLTGADVEFPAERLVDKLRAEQEAHFASKAGVR